MTKICLYCHPVNSRKSGTKGNCEYCKPSNYEQYDETIQPRQQPFVQYCSRLSTKWKDQDVFCTKCIMNQNLVLEILQNQDHVDDSFKAGLEARYPLSCPECQPKIQRHLDDEHSKLSIFSQRKSGTVEQRPAINSIISNRLFMQNTIVLVIFISGIVSSISLWLQLFADLLGIPSDLYFVPWMKSTQHVLVSFCPHLSYCLFNDNSILQSRPGVNIFHLIFSGMVLSRLVVPSDWVDLIVFLLMNLVST